MSKKKNIVLWGHMASGKTSLGLALSNKLGLGFIDTDLWVEKKAKKSIRKIFEDRGEEAFRKLEAEVVQSLLGCRNQVIAVGGGAVENDQSLDTLVKLGWTVWINTPVKVLVQRLIDKPLELEHRPLIASCLAGKLGPSEQIDALEKLLTEDLNQRKVNFAKADIQVDGSLSTIDTTSTYISRSWQI